MPPTYGCMYVYYVRMSSSMGRVRSWSCVKAGWNRTSSVTSVSGVYRDLRTLVSSVEKIVERFSLSPVMHSKDPRYPVSRVAEPTACHDHEYPFSKRH